MPPPPSSPLLDSYQRLLAWAGALRAIGESPDNPFSVAVAHQRRTGRPPADDPVLIEAQLALLNELLRHTSHVLDAVRRERLKAQRRVDRARSAAQAAAVIDLRDAPDEALGGGSACAAPAPGR